MKAFWVGLIFLAALALFASLGFMLYPLLAVMGVLLRLAISLAVIFLFVWGLGKVILWLWKKIK